MLIPSAIDKKTMLLKIFTILATVGFGSLSVQLLFFPSPVATEANTQLVSGTLKKIEHISRSRGNDTLQIWLEDQPTPYRANSGFPKHFRDDYMLHFTQGSEVELRIERNEVDRVRKDYTTNQEFQPLCALSSDQEQLFRLQDFNAYRTSNTRIGRIVAPTLTGCGVFLGWIVFGMPGHRKAEQ